MTAPEKMVLQPCPTYGWDHPDRVKYPVEPAVEYIRADLIPAALAVPEVAALVEALERIESITVHSGGKIHGVTALHWQIAFEMARDEAEFALAALRGEGRG